MSRNPAMHPAVDDATAYEDHNARALVVVINNRRDLEIAHTQGWYRIPMKRAPRRVAADYLAFYQTGTFGEEGHQVRYYAPVQRFRIVSRAELLPEEPDHPRASDRYYKVEFGPLQRLPQAIPSQRLRRITFIPTTLGRLLAAEEINDLWWRDDPQERLWAALRERRLRVEYHYLVEDAPANQRAIDFALFCRNGRIAILCGDPGQDDEGGLRERRPAEYALITAGWQVMRFSEDELLETLSACVAAVVNLVQHLGGQKQ